MFLAGVSKPSTNLYNGNAELVRWNGKTFLAGDSRSVPNTRKAWLSRRSSKCCGIVEVA